MDFIDPKKCPWFQEIWDILENPRPGGVERVKELTKLISDRSKVRTEAYNADLSARIEAINNRG